ncbi:hypothetical protein [Brevundimonas intermedia]|uniref:hypothetical protein n=1 Tax=Brevundimonas intermedia TaxID=74315 RepID=UPI003208D4F6
MPWFNRRRAVIAMLAAAVVLGVPLAAKALLVQPIVVEMTTIGSGSTAAIEVVNDRNSTVTVEISVEDLLVPTSGAVSTAPNDGSEFLIFPPQAVIPAGGRQVFRARWVGEPDLEKTKLYMFTTSELPVGLPEGTTGVELYYAVQSIVSVTPPGATSSVAIPTVERGENATGEQGLWLTFDNTGRAHAYVGQGQVALSSSTGWSRTLTADLVGAAFGLGLVPPQASRRMFVAVPDLPTADTFTATFTPASPR